MMFNERLAMALSNANMTQRELAAKININEAAMSRYVNGSRKPRMDILVNIARTLNVSVEYLSGEEEQNSGYEEVKNLVCRNLSNLTDEQRRELMSILERGK